MSQAGIVAADIIADLIGQAEAAREISQYVLVDAGPRKQRQDRRRLCSGAKDGKAILQANDEFISKPDDSPEIRRQTYQESADWYQSVVAELFGEELQKAGH